MRAVREGLHKQLHRGPCSAKSEAPQRPAHAIGWRRGGGGGGDALTLLPWRPGQPSGRGNPEAKIDINLSQTVQQPTTQGQSMGANWSATRHGCRRAAAAAELNPSMPSFRESGSRGSLGANRDPPFERESFSTSVRQKIPAGCKSFSAANIYRNSGYLWHLTVSLERSRERHPPCPPFPLWECRGLWRMSSARNTFLWVTSTVARAELAGFYWHT
jgi:hypothetical protein